MKHTQRNINHITYKNMHDTISKYVLSLGLFVLLAGDCNPTPDPIAGQALFKKLDFTVDKVNYNFDFEAEPAPGTLSINDKSVNLANAQQTASGATLVVDGKTYGVAYKNINDTVYLTLTLPYDVGSLPTSITLHTLLVSEKSTLVDQNGASITEGQSLSRRNDAFITKIISEDGKKNTIYNIKLEQSTLHLQAVSYSGGTFETVEGKEMPVLGIAIEDNILTDESMLISVSGLQSNVMYQYQIGTEGDKQDIEASSTGKIELKKSHLKNGDAISIKDDEDIMLYSASDNLLGIIARYKRYKIHDWKDLQGMRIDLGASYTLENNIVLHDLGMGGLPMGGFEPIGTLIVNTDGDIIHDKSTPFTGKLNVVDKKLGPNKIMRLSIDRSSEDGVGLFAYVRDAEIRNLMIESRTIKGANYVGALAGAAGENTKIEDVGVTGGNVRATDIVGGLVGYNDGTITSCYATGDVTGSNSGSESNVGGLVGDQRGTITSCYATGDVTGSTNYVGGLVGSNLGTITSCYATGAVTGEDAVGGLVGYNSDTITSCYATGAVTGDDSVGGLVGAIDLGSTITFCYATGAVNGTGDNVGGLVGSNFGMITSCYATGDVRASIHVGGLVGSNVSSGGTITSCYATGAVNGTGNNVGGLVGSNLGKITSCYAIGAVNGTGNNVGGLVGLSAFATTITSCYYDKETTGRGVIGVGSGSSGGVNGLAKLNIKTDKEGDPFILDKPGTEAVEGFNFVTVWKFEEGKWPTLTWETNQGL